MTGGPRLLRLVNEIRPYPWGSTTAIPTLLGLEPDGEPAAEMWIGAHAGSPSLVHRPQDAPDPSGTLLAAVHSDPERLLGPAVSARFGGALPFLLKLLAAESPLSLQTHPTVAQANEGYDGEDADGIALGSPQRSYQDRNHKPELLCALTPFEALCGFRPVAESARFLRALAAAGAWPLESMAQRLIAEGGLRDVVTWLLTLPAIDQASLVEAAAPAASVLAEGGGEWSRPAAAVASIAAIYPVDAGVVLAMLLNHVCLEPGEAIYLAAGQIHAYLSGFGVELMASSDNVLRAGLTPKHVNVPELLRTLDFDDCPVATIRPAQAPGLEQTYPVPVPDFALSRLELGAGESVTLDAAGPSIVVCIEGSARLHTAATDSSDGGETLELLPGASAFALPGPPIIVQGPCLAFRATTGSAVEPGTP
jgi:mannose-6-phosphate isomerase